MRSRQPSGCGLIWFVVLLAVVRAHLLAQHGGTKLLERVANLRVHVVQHANSSACRAWRGGDDENAIRLVDTYASVCEFPSPGVPAPPFENLLGP